MTPAKYLEYPATDLTGKKPRNPDASIEVTYSVSITYNGGTIGPDGEHYAGFSVPPPILPEGYVLVGIGVGHQLNARPPYATEVMTPIHMLTDTQRERFLAKHSVDSTDMVLHVPQSAGKSV